MEGGNLLETGWVSLSPYCSQWFLCSLCTDLLTEVVVGASGVKASPTERGSSLLFDAVNSYRRANGLSNLKCDEVLTELSYIHTLDQEAVHPLKSSECPANGHNWLSRVGEKNGRNMKPCCFKKDGSDCMWKKPNELYSWYKGYGFEISVVLGSDSDSPEAAAKGALNSWKGSKGHNDVILAKGATWKKLTRIGCFRKGKFANCWFSSGYQGYYQ